MDPDLYDAVAVGFGPAGIALAAAMDDADEEKLLAPAMRALFLERAAAPDWQPDMLLPGTDIQHHFLRDFATPRNPRSRYTFANYLKLKGRLFEFGLLGGHVGRIEWADYVRWVAGQVDGRARFGHEVTAIEPHDGSVHGPRRLRVMARDLSTGRTVAYTTRNVVLASGRRPSIPDVFRPWLGPRVFHSHYFKRHVTALDPAGRPRVVVIGSGQNAIEIILFLADAFPQSPLFSVNRNHGFRTYDTGHFSNEVYFPKEVDYFFGLQPDARRHMFEEVRLTNYSSVDLDVSRALYLRCYEDHVQGTHRIRILKRVVVEAIERSGDAYRLCLRDRFTHIPHTLDADVIVLGTGFHEDHVPEYLAPLRPWLEFEEDGTLAVTRDYRVRTKAGFRPGLFMNGLSELTHGISDATSFSMMALKAQRIYEQLVQAADRRDADTAVPGGTAHDPVVR
jgi:L-ornithine N5-oxygenase